MQSNDTNSVIRSTYRLKLAALEVMRQAWAPLIVSVFVCDVAHEPVCGLSMDQSQLISRLEVVVMAANHKEALHLTWPLTAGRCNLSSCVT